MVYWSGPSWSIAWHTGHQHTVLLGPYLYVSLSLVSNQTSWWRLLGSSHQTSRDKCSHRASVHVTLTSKSRVDTFSSKIKPQASSSQRRSNVLGWWTELWSTEAKVCGIMLKAAWHWGGDSSITNDPFGAPGSTPS
jgi:hypothetical protein